MSYDEDRQRNIEIGQAINIAVSMVVSKSENMDFKAMLMKLRTLVPVVYNDLVDVREQITKKYHKKNMDIPK